MLLKKHHKKGSLLWELLVVLAILFIFLYSTVTFLGIFIQYQTLTYAAKTTARQIEVTGCYADAGTNAVSLIGSKLTDIHITVTPDTSVPLENTSAELATQLEVNKKLQLSQKFTLTISATYVWTVAGAGGLFSTISINVPMNYEVKGMSEVYWRTA